MDLLEQAQSKKLESSRVHYHAELFNRGGFVLRKWKASDDRILDKVPYHLKDERIIQHEQFTMILKMEWNSEVDTCQPLILSMVSDKVLTKRSLVSEIAMIYDILGWCSPPIIKMKFLLQRVSEPGIGCDEIVPSKVESAWNTWRRELPVLQDHMIPRYIAVK